MFSEVHLGNLFDGIRLFIRWEISWLDSIMSDYLSIYLPTYLSMSRWGNPVLLRCGALCSCHSGRFGGRGDGDGG